MRNVIERLVGRDIELGVWLIETGLVDDVALVIVERYVYLCADGLRLLVFFPCQGVAQTVIHGGVSGLHEVHDDVVRIGKNVKPVPIQ